MSLLTLILAESALEVVPKELRSHPSVLSHSRRAGKAPSRLILDRSYHHAAMKRLDRSWKRGRPDIVHISLLEALGSPLNREGLLRVFVHTFDDHVISVAPETRLPRNYMRFLGLMEQLFELGRVPPSGKPLLKIERKTLERLLEDIRPSYVLALSRTGRPTTVPEAVLRLTETERPTVMIGGFPAGHFEETTLNLADDIVSIDPETLEAWTVTSRVIYEYERAIRLPERRLKRQLKKVENKPSRD